MDSVNKTLYIPLYGKAYVTSRGLFLSDKKAEEIWGTEGFALKGKSKSKWLAFYMGIRAAVFDEWVTEKLIAFSGSTVIHIGCGMDSRVLRVGADHRWYDVDFPEVIKERKKYYTETESYTMLEGDARANDWLALIPDGNSAVVIMEGISMYLKTDELTALLENIGRKYQNVTILMDCYTVMAAKMSKYKNPINDVGVTTVHGIDDPELINGGGISFVKEHVMTPRKYIDELSGIEKAIFKRLYAGGLSKKLYRLFEFEKATERK